MRRGCSYVLSFEMSDWEGLAAGRSVWVRRPIDWTGDDGVTGQFAAEHALGGARGVDHRGQPPSSPKLDSKLAQPTCRAANALAKPWPRVLWKCAVTSTPGNRSMAAA